MKTRDANGEFEDEGRNLWRARLARETTNESVPVDAGAPISNYMQTELNYLREDMSVAAVRAFFFQRGLETAPVVDEAGRPIGLISKMELEAGLGELGEEEAAEAADAQAEAGAGARARARARARGWQPGRLATETPDGFLQLLGSGFHLENAPLWSASDIMKPLVGAVPRHTSVAEGARMMIRRKLEVLIVVADDGTLAGLFSPLDLARWLAAETEPHPPRRGTVVRDRRRAAITRSRAGSQTLSEIMRPCVASVDRKDPLPRARRVLEACGATHVPVLSGKNLAGVLGASQIFEEGGAWVDELTVDDVMKLPTVLTWDAPTSRAGTLLDDHRIECVLVIDDKGRVVGTVTKRELEEAAGGAQEQVAAPVAGSA